MCHCTTAFDIRCRCLPMDNLQHFQVCPARIDTAVWLTDNDNDTHMAARRGDFTHLLTWFPSTHQELDRREVELIYTNSMLEEIGKDYIDQLPVSIAREHEWDEEEWIEDDMACNNKETERQVYMRWIQKRIECKLRIFRLKQIAGLQM